MCLVIDQLHYMNTVVKTNCQVAPTKQLDIQHIASLDSIRYFYWIHSLRNLSSAARLLFVIIVGVIFVFGFLGNLLTIIANLRRKQRILFKVSLISLALSDILLVTFTSVTYISQFTSEFTSLWILGSSMCLITPFVQTTALLANSITLVAIALDRYIAVGKIIKQTWDPTMMWCVITALFIWALSAGISSPMFTLYELYNVLILIPDPNNSTIPVDYSIAQVCATNKTESFQYFLFIFAFIFTPLLIAFVWLNIVIAKEIWDRRHPISQVTVVRSKQVSSDKKTSETNMVQGGGSSNRTVSTISNNVPSEKPQKSFGSKNRGNYSTTSSTVKTKSQDPVHNDSRNRREQRQLRMVKVIVVIMTIFFICRLPNWAFLLVKLQVRLVGKIYWVVHYSLGILSMASCLLNPFVYTFLSETIQFTTFMAAVCRKICFWKCCSRSESSNGDGSFNESYKNLCEHGGVYLGDGK
jgi:hypothetical protein